MKVRIDPTVRQKEDEDRHADQSAADADQRAERAHEKSKQKKQQNIKPHKTTSSNIILHARKGLMRNVFMIIAH